MSFPVYFDFDGTLVDTLPGLVEAANELRRWRGLPPATQATVKTWIGGGLDALLGAAMNGEAVDAATRERFVEYYIGSPLLDSLPYVGIGDLLDELRQAQLPLAIVTNKNQRSVDLLLDKLAWREKFAAVLCPQNGLKKPDRRFLALAAKRLSLPLGPGLFIGDSEFDVEAAHNAGIVAVAVTWGYRPLAVLQAANPQFLVRDVSELKSLIFSQAASPL
jgi:phosphoglycolate phosphatase